MNSKIKILYIVNSLNIGGSEKVLIDSANSLDLERYSVTIISLSLFNQEKTILKIAAPKKDIEVFYFDFTFFDNYSSLGYVWLLLKSRSEYKGLEPVIRLVNKIQPHIIHFHTTPRELLLKKFFALKVPYVFTDHLLRLGKNELPALQARIMTYVFRKMYAGFHIITVSEEITKNLQANKIASAGKIILTLLNGVDVTFFQNTDKKEKSKELVAVYISRIEHIKGHEELVRAWAKLKEIPGKKLYLAGPDGLNGKTRQLAVELGCADSVIFTGPVSDPKALLLKATLAVFPSYKEGLPLSLLEKMAMGLPVIVSDIAELRAIITDKKDGLIYRSGDQNALAEKIRYLHAHQELAQTLGKNARATVLSKYNFAENIKQLDTFYFSLLN